jgi:hypothetical protein
LLPEILERRAARLGTGIGEQRLLLGVHNHDSLNARQAVGPGRFPKMVARGYGPSLPMRRCVTMPIALLQREVVDDKRRLCAIRKLKSRRSFATT